jgi:hypothetical protein
MLFLLFCSIAFPVFFLVLRAGGGQLSQGSLKLFVFDSRSCAGTVAFFRSLGGGVLVGD